MNDNLQKLINLGDKCSLKDFNILWQKIEKDKEISKNLKSKILSNVKTTKDKIILAADYNALTV